MYVAFMYTANETFLSNNHNQSIPMKIFRKLTHFLVGRKSVPDKEPAFGVSHAVTLNDIERHLFPLLQNTTVVRVQQATKLHPQSSIRSQFGGNPYFMEGMEWPKSKDGVPLDFIFQVFANADTQLPNDIKLIQLFYNHEKFPQQTADDGWEVSIFTELNTRKHIELEKPPGLSDKPYCPISFEPELSLPDWESLQVYHPEIAGLIEQFNPDEPSEVYNSLCEKLVDHCYYQTQLGGYPRWVQHEAAPKDSRGISMPLLFQVDSEDSAGLMWGDLGMVYLFYNKTDGQIWMELQSY